MMRPYVMQKVIKKPLIKRKIIRRPLIKRRIVKKRLINSATTKKATVSENTVVAPIQVKVPASQTYRQLIIKPAVHTIREQVRVNKLPSKTVKLDRIVEPTKT